MRIRHDEFKNKSITNFTLKHYLAKLNNKKYKIKCFYLLEIILFSSCI